VTSGSGSTERVFRLPASTYLVVLFLFFGTIPLAFTRSAFTFDARGGEQGAPLVVGWHTLFLLLPVAIALFIRRTATFVDGDGIRVRAVLGSRQLPWPEIRGLAVSGRSVYAVLADGSVRLPCVRQADLSAVARASAGRLPPIADPKPKFAPQRRRRR
jgi:PH (Pleckstrin Homology) domain-containing protein